MTVLRQVTTQPSMHSRAAWQAGVPDRPGTSAAVLAMERLSQPAKLRRRMAISRDPITPNRDIFLRARAHDGRLPGDCIFPQRSKEQLSQAMAARPTRAAQRDMAESAATRLDEPAWQAPQVARTSRQTQHRSRSPQRLLLLQQHKSAAAPHSAAQAPGRVAGRKGVLAACRRSADARKS